MSVEEAQSVISVEGSAVIRLRPTAIRIVFALTTEAETSSQCSEKMEALIARLTPDLKAAGVRSQNLVEDFISVLPKYEFEITKLNEQTVAKEKRVGFLMQTNLHIEVASDAAAMKVLKAAFANDVTDIIGFDYWSDQLDAKKKEVRAKALEAAKEKSDLLLGVFSKRPTPINIQEQTVVHYPAELYESFENSSSQEYSSNYYDRRDIPRIRLPRPKNTYYRSMNPNVDVQPKSLAMRPELSVVSTVRIQYASPAAAAFNSGRIKKGK